MLEEYLKLYMSDTRRLAQLITIKHGETAELENELIMIKHGKSAVDPDDPKTWRYYLHLSGQYHPTDTPMTVNSLDTGEIITFSSDVLKIHTQTFNRYRELGLEYYTLADNHPDQEMLIRGILYPTDIQTTIDAEDGTILAYPNSLIEPQEITLLSDLETWIKNYLVRWHTKPFMTSDTLYPASYQAVLYLNLYPRLLNLRLVRDKTPEAHSFHIRAYLASHGYLDRYYDYLDQYQKLWLYRNILYIERHSGIKEDFSEIVRVMLSTRKIPLSEYVAKQYDGYNDEFYPNYYFQKKPINTPYNIPAKDYYTLADMQYKETNTAYYNETYWQEQYSKIEKTIQNSGNAVMLTKDLESIMYDYTDSVPHPLPAVMMSEWGYHAYQRTYQTLVTFKHPTKSEIYTVPADIAYAYIMHLTLRSAGVRLDRLPTVHISGALRDPKPDVAEILEATLYDSGEMVELARYLISDMPNNGRIYSSQVFKQYATRIYRSRMMHWILVANIHEVYDRAYIQGMINRLFNDLVVDLNTTLNPDGLNIDSWLSQNNLPSDDFNYEDTVTLMQEIFDRATGYITDKSLSLKYVQRAMIAIMQQLSSYSIQILTEMMDSNIRPINWSTSRVGDVKNSFNANYHIESMQLQHFAQTQNQYIAKPIDPSEPLWYVGELEPPTTYRIDPNRRYNRGISKSQQSWDINIQDFDNIITSNETCSNSYNIDTEIVLNRTISTDHSIVLKSFDVGLSFGGLPMQSWMTQELTQDELSQLIA